MVLFILFQEINWEEELHYSNESMHLTNDQIDQLLAAEDSKRCSEGKLQRPGSDQLRACIEHRTDLLASAIIDTINKESENNSASILHEGLLRIHSENRDRKSSVSNDHSYFIDWQMDDS